MRLRPIPDQPRSFALEEAGEADRAMLGAHGLTLTPGGLAQASSTRLSEILPVREWQIRSRTLVLERTLVMGIVNVTPDSFSDAGRYFAPERAIAHAERLLAEGADILDIGAESTRPGHLPVPPDEEWARLEPVLEAVVHRSPAPVSVDTRSAEVARRALDLGVDIINDVSGLNDDGTLGAAVAAANAGYVGMVNGDPISRQQDAVAFAADGMLAVARRAEAAGIARPCTMLDPGFGFAIRGSSNLGLLRRFDELTLLGYPLLAGMSRKWFIGQALNADVGNRLEGSLAAAVLAAWQGAAVLRVHDVEPTRKALSLVDAVVHQ